MLKTTATTKQTDKRQAILDAALTLFVSQGFHATSTAAIATQAKVATGTLFHHFPSKDSLMACLFLTIKQEFADALLASFDPDASIKQKIAYLWQTAIDWSLNKPDKQLFFQQYSMSPALSPELRAQAMDGILGFLRELIVQGQAQGIIAPYPVALLLEHCHSQYLGATRFFIDNPALGQDTQHRDASFQLFWRALNAESLQGNSNRSESEMQRDK